MRTCTEGWTPGHKLKDRKLCAPEMSHACSETANGERGRDSMQGITCHARHLGLNPEYERDPLLDCKKRGRTLLLAFKEGRANRGVQGGDR